MARRVTTGATRKATSGSFKPGSDPRRGPGSRAPASARISNYLKEFVGLSPVQLADYCEIFAKELKKHKGDMPIAGVIAARVLMALMDEPQPALLREVMDRVDGVLTMKNENTETGSLVIRIERENHNADASDAAPGPAPDQAGGAAL